MPDLRSLVFPGLFLLLTACAGTGPLVDAGGLAGRTVSTAAEPPRPLERRYAEATDPSMVTGQAIGTLVAGIAAANEQQRSRIGSVVAPSVDPARSVEAIIAEHLVRERGAVPGRTPVNVGDIGYSDPQQRAPEITRRARVQGIGGVVVDVLATEMAAVSTGVGLGLRREEFYLSLAANFALVDVETGRILAQGTCSRAAEDRPYSFPEMQAGGQPLIDRAFETLAQQCAAQLISGLRL
jgi:hypothetical protein